jgi:hypothetical protein
MDTPEKCPVATKVKKHYHGMSTTTVIDCDYNSLIRKGDVKNENWRHLAYFLYG